jgi:DNA-binding NarL/FixJ family response regulator
MPKFVRACPPPDDGEARKVRRLAGARHAPADWSERARIITLSWDGLTVPVIAGTDLVGAVRTVASGQSTLDPGAASQVMARLRDHRDKPGPLDGLTPQERRILELIGEGLTNRQIGERLFLAEKTVKNYVSVLFAKLGMERRTQAAAYAARVFDELTAG